MGLMPIRDISVDTDLEVSLPSPGVAKPVEPICGIPLRSVVVDLGVMEPGLLLHRPRRVLQRRRWMGRTLASPRAAAAAIVCAFLLLEFGCRVREPRAADRMLSYRPPSTVEGNPEPMEEHTEGSRLRDSSIQWFLFEGLDPYPGGAGERAAMAERRPQKPRARAGHTLYLDGYMYWQIPHDYTTREVTPSMLGARLCE